MFVRPIGADLVDVLSLAEGLTEGLIERALSITMALDLPR